MLKLQNKIIINYLGWNHMIDLWGLSDEMIMRFSVCVQ